MAIINLDVPEIPHGHGLSFKKGVSDALLDNRSNENTCHKTHSASYQRGQELGIKFKELLARHVKA